MLELSLSNQNQLMPNLIGRTDHIAKISVYNLNFDHK